MYSAADIITLYSISIHALREEGDATAKELDAGGEISIHALREEGDAFAPGGGDFVIISIHALREEGDRSRTRSSTASRNFYPRPPRGGRPGDFLVYAHIPVFLSTPSARRATGGLQRHAHRQPISIHALREEGDPSTASRWQPITRFLSTPSARRATAKTETKSLFSNKLYNILHEFRRALIYNGSKNDPNHAK